MLSFFNQWLQDDFLDFLDSWEKESESLEKVTKEVKQRMCISRETLEGLRITGNYLLHFYFYCGSCSCMSSTKLQILKLN